MTGYERAQEHFWRARLLVEESGDDHEPTSTSEAALVGRAYAEVWRGLLSLAVEHAPAAATDAAYHQLRTEAIAASAALSRLLQGYSPER